MSDSLVIRANGSQKEQHEVTKIDRYQWFLSIGILFLILHLFMGYRSMLAVFLLFFGFYSGTASAQSLDSYLKSKQGTQQYQSGDFETSAKSYEDARKDGQDNAILQFNEGTALAKAKKGEDALFLLQESTKKALSQGDYETAAKSLYNEGVTQAEGKNLKEAYDRLTKSIEMAKISNQPELEKKGREALLSLIEKQKQQSQDQKDQKNKDQKEGKDSKQDSKSQDDQKNQPKDQNQKDQKGQKKDNPSGVEKRGFKSGPLSKDVAESIMHDLSDREKQLYQKRMKDKKPQGTNHEKDW